MNRKNTWWPGGSLMAAVVLWTAGTSSAQDSPIADALSEAQQAVDEIIAVSADQRTFDNTLAALDDMLARLEFETSMVQFMPYVSPDKALRDSGQAATVELQAWLIDLQRNEDLYKAVKTFADSNPQLYGEQQRLLEHTLRDYRRAGMDLPVAQRGRLSEIQKTLSKLSIEFDQNIQEDETSVLVARDELSGMSDEYINGLERAGDFYVISMDYPTYLPLQENCDNGATREKVWIAYKRRGGQKNVDVLQQILELRAEAASLLGYAHPADYETEVKMAKSAANVQDFYAKLRPLVRQKAIKDYREIVGAKRKHVNDIHAPLKPWDYSFYKNMLMRDKYAVDAEKVREYFPIENVIDGLFSITQSLYGLRYVEMTNDARGYGQLWHEDVRKFDVYDTRSDELLGAFFIDLHPRDNKYGHAAQWGLKQHKRWRDGTYGKPLAALVCNFTKPTADKPSLMSHDEVETFFHEFGHCLHTILADGDYYKFAGTAVERDFVEAPSQMFENWVWDARVLRTFAKHYKTGEVFPDELLDGMMRARSLGSGMEAERQFYYGLFDLTCHMDPEGDIDTTQLQHDLWSGRGENVELYAPVPGTFFQAAFGHLTGYQAGYYGYQWSLVYACDMFQRFKELGMLDPEAGMYYREKILSRGGRMDGLDMVTDYLGREPDLTAYLEHLGLND